MPHNRNARYLDSPGCQYEQVQAVPQMATQRNNLQLPSLHSRPAAAFMNKSVQNGSSRRPSTSSSNYSYQSEDKYSACASVRGELLPPFVTDKYKLSPDPSNWGADLSPGLVEDDDYLHNPDPKRDLKYDTTRNLLTWRGLSNVGSLCVLCLGLVALFAGYPIVTYLQKSAPSNMGGFNIGGINATGQIASIGNFGLIDQDTPQAAYTTPSWNDGSEMQLVFSDEFNTDGRSFYPGDDPYWEAVDLHYWATDNLEWYDPEAVTTGDGSLRITLSKKETHGLHYQGGMVATWNKFCFTGGYIETSVSLPGVNDVVGLWPAIWTLGNLARAGYGASLEGMWPYTYDACDVGTAPNQTLNGLPIAAATDGYNGAPLSFLPGQRLSRCTCAGESHPGPMHSDGTFVGRAAPEIDIFEAQITDEEGFVSQSAQWAPFNDLYEWFNSTDNMVIPDPSVSEANSYLGGNLQQATSVVTKTNQDCYTGETGCFSIYGFEYKPGFDDAYISWIANNKVSWTLKQAGMAADTRVEISGRPVPQEPMYIIINVGMSMNFGTVDLEDLPFPVTMEVDYVRVYQPVDAVNIGCDPPDFPTSAYINQYMEAYTNPNLTTWRDDFGQPFPKSSFLGQC